MRLFCRHRWMFKHTVAISGKVYVVRRCSFCHKYQRIYVGEEYGL